MGQKVKEFKMIFHKYKYQLQVGPMSFVHAVAVSVRDKNSNELTTMLYADRP